MWLTPLPGCRRTSRRRGRACRPAARRSPGPGCGDGTQRKFEILGGFTPQGIVESADAVEQCAAEHDGRGKDRLKSDQSREQGCFEQPDAVAEVAAPFRPVIVRNLQEFAFPGPGIADHIDEIGEQEIGVWSQHGSRRVAASACPAAKHRRGRTARSIGCATPQFQRCVRGRCRGSPRSGWCARWAETERPAPGCRRLNHHRRR